MPKWKKDAKEFTVAVHHKEASGYYTTSIPKPVIDLLSRHEEVKAITYLLKGKKVVVKKAGTED